MNKFLQNKESLFLLLILVIGTILRFFQYADWSLTNDELSALYQLTFGDGFFESVKIGVAKDNHPAGVHIFLYLWTGLFGDSAAAVRFPFIIMGVASILLTYLVAKKWFNGTTALFAAAAVSFTEFPVLYSQLARPYSAGLFMTLLAAFFWTLFVVRKEKLGLPYLLGFIFSAAGCAYIHYFAFLQVVIIGVTGLFLLRGKKLLYYLGAGLGVVLLYLPHLSLTMIHLTRGGLEEWLSAPENDFFVQHLSYIMNDSSLVMIAVAGLAAFAVFAARWPLKWKKFHSISILWFILPLFIGFFYSIYRKPILQHSLLLFSLPYFFIFTFSFFQPVLTRVKSGLLLGFLLIGFYSIAIEKDFYKTQHFGEFKALAEAVVEWNGNYGKENISKVVNFNSPYYIRYYLGRMGEEEEFQKYFMDYGDHFGELKSIVEESKTQYFLYGWSTRHNHRENMEIIRQKYPVIVEDKQFFNSGITLLGKGDTQRNPLAYFKNDFEQRYQGWPEQEKYLDTTRAFSGKYSQRLGKDGEFGSTFEMPVWDITNKYADVYFVIKAKVYLQENGDGNLVFSVNRKGEELEWYATEFSHYIEDPGEWKTVLTARDVPEGILPNDVIRIYTWSRGEGDVFIDDIEIEVYPQPIEILKK